MMNLPLFPLHTVLCPGVALPLHIFEDRYKAMVETCLADDSPFGVVLIREATRYPDGRFDLVTLGTQRFRLESVRLSPSQFLVGEMEPMGEVLGAADRARRLADRVSQRFIRYLELLQLDDDGDEDASQSPDTEIGGTPWGLQSEPIAEAESVAADAEDRSDIDARMAELDDAARRLAIPNDPTVVSYLFSGIVQVESIRRQLLLEMDTTEERLAELSRMLELEISLLERRLMNYQADPRLLNLRRN